MLLVLSPSKTLDYATSYDFKEFTHPQFLSDSEMLVAKLKTMSEAQIAKMMEISPKLASLNAQRFQDFNTPFSPANARQAIFAFKGDVYEGIDVAHYSNKDFAFAQEHVRILSGLYGLLRPLDLIQPYRLEMGRSLDMGKTKDLYSFWGKKIAESLHKKLSMQKTKVLINLASKEYEGAVDRKVLGFPVVDVVFKERSEGALKIVALYAKKARGMMANYIVKNQIDEPDGLRDFSEGGYRLHRSLSGPNTLTFVRKAS